MPFFSIITPVYNPPIWALNECIESVLNQTFTDWEWCIADDASTNSQVLDVLTDLARRESRVKLFKRPLNGGIVEASNSAMSIASGLFVALLDHDDSLTLNALENVHLTLSKDNQIDYIYSDEDKIDSDGKCFDEFRKPDFSPERLRGQNYCCHLSVFRRTLLDEVGGFRPGFDGSQDYDLILRATEQARKIVHIPEVLYHWRQVEGSTSQDSDAKPYAFESARRAVEEHCQRVGIVAEVTSTAYGYVKVKRELSSKPLVSIVIPTRGDRKRLFGIDTCLVSNSIQSIFEKSTYVNYEIIVVHDTSNTLSKEMEDLLKDPRIKIVWYDKPFDFSEKCNIGAASSSGDVIILLNDDTEVISPDWIDWLLGYLEDPNVAVVGPMTLLEDSRVQSAGHSNNPLPHNLGAGDSCKFGGSFGERLVAREISGVTGACLATRLSTYFELGGMTSSLPHSFNDVDFTFKAAEFGYKTLWTPYVQIRHFESLSRDPEVREEELEVLTSRWGRYFGCDIYTRT